MVRIRFSGRDMMHGHGFIDTNGSLDMFDASFVAENVFFFHTQMEKYIDIIHCGDLVGFFFVWMHHYLGVRGRA